MLLATNPGVSFLELIGPSDVAYVIVLLKNSIDVWKFDIQRPGGRPPKPLYTRVENMKRECGKTAWNEAGIKYYEDALKKWKKVYCPQEYFGMLANGWQEWLHDVASNVNPVSWTRKDMSRLLATREEAEMAMAAGSGGDETDVDDIVVYDSEDDGAPMIGPGGARRGGGRYREVDDNAGDAGMEPGAGHGDDESSDDESGFMDKYYDSIMVIIWKR